MTLNKPEISYEHFSTLDLKVGRVLSAERVDRSEKLIKLEVDLGSEKRQIISGIFPHYTPSNLVGKQLVIVTNIAGRKMMGLESNGMILCASVEGTPVVLTPDRPVPNGVEVC